MDEFYVEEPPPEDDEEEEPCLLGELEGERMDGMARGEQEEQEEQEDYRRNLLRMVKKISLVGKRVAV